MRLIAAFLQMIRLPNLIFIAITQILFQYCIYRPLYDDVVPANDLLQFLFLVAASVSIAAAGYIINDYFDLNIDQVNKPGRMVVDKIISRRWAIAWHLLLSVTGIIFTIFALPLYQKWYLIIANVFCVVLLWFYSTSLKRSLLIGNIVIAMLTAWTILIIFFSKVSLTDAFGSTNTEENAKFFRFTMLYAGFAFMISLIREAIKDMEDMEGDAREGCRTMPIVWGLNASKVYVAVWLVVVLALLVVIQVYVLQFEWFIPVIYLAIFILLPLVYILAGLYRARTPAQFHNLSNWTKFVMLAGIMSILFFYYYLSDSLIDI